MKNKILLTSIILFCINNIYSADIIYNYPGTISTITGTLSVPNNLVVKKSSFLKITGTIYLSTNSKIIIEPGAVLLLQGGILTSSSNNSSTSWMGIEVQGNGSYPAGVASFAVENYFLNNYPSLTSGIFYSTSNGLVKPEIKFSKFGIVSSEIGSSVPANTKSGGYIECWHTTFNTNIYSSIYLSKASGNTPIQNTSRVQYCTFTSALTSSIPLVDQFAQVMNKGGNLRIFSCTFSANNYSDNYIIGIRSIAAKSAIFSNTFTNLKSAVYVQQENSSGNTSTYSYIQQNTINHKGNTPFYGISIDNSDLINVSMNKINYFTNLTGSAIIDVSASDKIRIELNEFNYQGTVSPADYSMGIGISYSSISFGQAHSNTFNNIHTGIYVLQQNQGFIFKCNKFYSTRGSDLRIASPNGTIAPIQLAGKVSAENYFLPIPTTPSNRMNLSTINRSQTPNFFYYFSISNSVTNPMNATPSYTFATPVKSLNNACQLILPIVSPQPNDDPNDRTYGIASLSLPTRQQNTYVHYQNIMEKAKLVCGYLDNDLFYLDSNLADIRDNSEQPNLIDSAIQTLAGDTTFAAIYTLSKLYLNDPGSVSKALDLVANSSHNDNQELINYKVLFPIVVEGIRSEFNADWLSINMTKLEKLSNLKGFVAAQARSMLEYHSNAKSITENLYTNHSYNFEATCSPNPFSNQITLQVSNAEPSINSLDIEFFDRNGLSQLKVKKDIGTNMTSDILIELASIPQGLYTCIIKNGDNLLKCLYLLKN